MIVWTSNVSVERDQPNRYQFRKSSVLTRNDRNKLYILKSVRFPKLCHTTNGRKCSISVYAIKRSISNGLI